VFAIEEKSGIEVNGEHQTTVKRIHSSAKVTAAPLTAEAATTPVTQERYADE
jgi:hypothetical protein